MMPSGAREEAEALLQRGEGRLFRARGTAYAKAYGKEHMRASEGRPGRPQVRGRGQDTGCGEDGGWSLYPQDKRLPWEAGLEGQMEAGSHETGTGGQVGGEWAMQTEEMGGAW